MRLSAIVITKNAGVKIIDCLESLKFADEVIVVDSGSTDKTKELAVKSGAKFFEVENMGYSHSRDTGAQKAKGDWLLYVDADERATDILSEIILREINALTHQRINSFRIYRKNIILGRWLRHGGWWPDPVHRLIKKSALKGWRGELHEYPAVDGEVGLTTEPIVHLSKDSISEMVKNSRQFAPIEADLKFKAGHPPVKIYHFILAMWREFWTRGILKAGWLDGVVGIIEIFYQMFHQFMVYSILWQMQ
ncbi:MAG: glycosyltransferase family 2 protein, partial [Patescibacteria group bacterium]